MTEKGRYQLVAHDVWKSFLMGKTRVVALRNINVAIERGEFLAISGSSGSGKTTLLNLFGCIDKPSEGDIYIDEVRVRNLTPQQGALLRSKKIGYIFQTFNLLPTLTALENVEYPLILLNLSKAKRKHLAKEALDTVGLSNVYLHKPAELSGGQRQRVAVARAIVKRPNLIIADEPTANLDEDNSLQLLDLFKEIQKDGVTVVVASHDPLVLNRADRVFELTHGSQKAAPLKVAA